MKTGKCIRYEKVESQMTKTRVRIEPSRMRKARGLMAVVSMSAVLSVLSMGVKADIDFGSVTQGGPTGSQGGPVTGTGATGQHWAAMSGSTLKDTLETWSRTSGWTVVWDTEMNYLLRASASFSGSFQRVVTALVDSIHVNNPELTVTLYTGNRVIHVQTLLNETR